MHYSTVYFGRRLQNDQRTLLPPLLTSFRRLVAYYQVQGVVILNTT